MPTDEENQNANVTLDDVKGYIDKNKDSNDVKTFVAGLNPVSLDRVKEFVGKDKDAAAWLDSEKDKHSEKALKTWQDNNLDKYYQDRYKKEHPDEDPKDTEIANLKAQFEKMQADNLHKDLVNKAHEYLDKNKAKCRWLDRFIGKDEKETKRNLDDFIKGYAEDVNAGVATRLKGGYQPPKAGKAPNLAYTVDQIKGMSPQEINEHWDDVQKTLEANK